jgi:hypothetical protein
MRKIQYTYFKWESEIQHERCEAIGLFHGWGMFSIDGKPPVTMAIIENDEGFILTVNPEWVKFIDKEEKQVECSDLKGFINKEVFGDTIISVDTLQDYVGEKIEITDDIGRPSTLSGFPKAGGKRDEE